MAKTPRTRHEATPETHRLRNLAVWYREFAERAGSSAIWESRLRTAEDLNAAAERIEASLHASDPPNSDKNLDRHVAELRAEARRLTLMLKTVADPQDRDQFAARALEFSLRAEAIACSQEDPMVVRMNVKRYRLMLEGGINDEAQRHVVEEMLADAEAVLASRRDTDR